MIQFISVLPQVYKRTSTWPSTAFMIIDKIQTKAHTSVRENKYGAVQVIQTIIQACVTSKNYSKKYCKVMLQIPHYHRNFTNTRQ